MSRAVGAHIPRGHRQREAAVRAAEFRSHLRQQIIGAYSFTEDEAAAVFGPVGGYWSPGPPWTHTVTLTQPDPVHYEPHHCPTCGMCVCGCEDCHCRLTKACLCPDCPCGLGDTGSDAEVAAFEAAHWEHAEVNE